MWIRECRTERYVALEIDLDKLMDMPRAGQKVRAYIGVNHRQSNDGTITKIVKIEAPDEFNIVTQPRTPEEVRHWPGFGIGQPEMRAERRGLVGGPDASDDDDRAEAG